MSAEAVAFKNAGNALFKSGSYDAAIAEYTKSIQADSSYHVAYSNRSQAYFKMGQYQKAAEDGALCMRAKSDWPKGYHRCANGWYHLYAQNKSEAALTNCWEALKAASSNVGAGNADLAALDERVRPIWAEFQKRKESRLRGPEKLKAEGNNLFKASQYAEAIKKYEAAVEMCGEEPDYKYLKAICLNNCANCYKQASDFRKMQECCFQAQELLSKYDHKEAKILVKVWFNLAEAYKGIDKWKLAKETIMKCVLMHPDWDAANKMKNQIDTAIKAEKAYKARQGK